MTLINSIINKKRKRNRKIAQTNILTQLSKNYLIQNKFKSSNNKQIQNKGFLRCLVKKLIKFQIKIKIMMINKLIQTKMIIKKIKLIINKKNQLRKIIRKKLNNIFKILATKSARNLKN